jgi:competence protein ComEC
MNPPRLSPPSIRYAVIGLAVLAAIATSFLAQPASCAPKASSGEVVIDVLDVGQGDSILIRSPEGKTALIDAGPSKNVVGLLKSKGVTSIDLLVLSHHHSDHYGGMAEVIRAFRPKVFLATNSSHTTPMYLKLLQLVRDEGIKAIGPTESVRKIGLGSVVLNILPQPPEDTRDENDNSIGIRVEYGNFSALLTGDSEAPARGFWLKTCPKMVRDCTILKLAHHGSRNGTDARWLAAVRPEQAVVSLGAGNDYGHPHPETLSLLARERIPLLRTDQVGTIEIFSDGQTWDMTTSKRGRPSAEITSKPRAKPHPAPRDAKVATASHRIDLNTATAVQLMTIPGIGPASASKVIGGRPYETVDDLHKVRGLGAARIAELEPNVTVR